MKTIEQLREIKATTTWLQGIGAHKGKPAGELWVGDVIVWNGGYTSEVLEITGETPSRITVSIRSGGGVWSRTFHKNRIVAIQGMGVCDVTKADLAVIGRAAQ